MKTEFDYFIEILKQETEKQNNAGWFRDLKVFDVFAFAVVAKKRFTEENQKELNSKKQSGF